MSFFAGGGGKKVKPQFTGLSAQTSVSSLPIPIAWGQNRIAPNIIWQGDFASHKQKQKAGKGGGKVTSYTYSASFELGLCWGEVDSIVRVWKDQSKESDYTKLGFSFFPGTTPQAPWGYLVTAHPTEALGYSGISLLAVANYDLGQSNSLDQHSFEAKFRSFGTGYNADGLTDGADPTICIQEFLADTNFGVGFNLGIIDNLESTVDATTTGDGAFQTYCRAMGFSLSPVLQSQAEARETLLRWAKLCNTAIVWTGYKLKFHPYGSEEIENNGVVYTPVFPVRYELTDDDLISNGDDPITFDRNEPSDAYNSLNLIIANKDNEYNDLPVPWRDQGLIDQYGRREDENIDAHEVTEKGMAAIMVSLIGQRQAYTRNTYQFTLGEEYSLLEPVDVVQITDARLGTFLVMITEMEEQESGEFSVTADEYHGSISTPVASSPGGITNDPVDTNVAAGSVNPPIIFEPPVALAGTTQVWTAVSGGDGTTANPNWGGCFVWLSTDDITYNQVGEIDSPARQGKLSSNLLTYVGANPDTAHTLQVDLTMSAGELEDSSPDDAEAGLTLCYVDGELMSFETATLTTTSNYDLDNLWRGQYGSTIGAHSTGDDFARLDGAVFKYDLPPSYIGKTIYVKYQSFNIFGGAVEDLADCVAYDYVITGAGAGSGDGGVPSDPTGLTVTDTGGALQLVWDEALAIDNVLSFQVLRADGHGAAFIDADVIATVTGTSTVYTDASVAASTDYTYFLVAVNAVGPGMPSTGVDGTSSAGSGGGGGGGGGSGGGILPVVDGSIPPIFIQLSDGSLVYTEIL